MDPSSQFYNLSSCSDDFRMPSSDSYSDDSRTAAGSDDTSLLVDHLANNYGLDNDYRGELHTFSQLARSLPCVQSKVVLIQHANTLQNQQAIEQLMRMCTTIQNNIDTLLQSVSNSTKFTLEHKAEITAACKAVFSTGRLTDFDNDSLKPQVILHLKKHKDVNGFKLFFEDMSQAQSKALLNLTGRTLSQVKTSFRRMVIKSLPGENNVGCGIKELTNTLGSKYLGGTENVKPKHAIWLLIIRSFVRTDPELRMAPADVDSDNDVALSRLRPVTASSLRPSGIDRKKLWKRKNKQFGTVDLKAAPWTSYINNCVVEERVLFPNDALALIVGNDGGVAPAPATLNRLSGVSSEAGGSRGPLPLTAVTNTSTASTSSGNRASLDNLINTPTLFTYNGAPMNSGSGFVFPSLNVRDREAGARYQAPSR
ncbi:hypothetical protein MSAN_00876000 [Mycena sanguinolenta]|uniref:Uncharacterized protein n=1 Tax=Mycena sanguinolenta TaxID=230812 RepID=A0A8H7DDH4_9AGAR|nr:hypothetical protein MSAN_00876000 [Mycena sanguinolenta]